MTGPSPELEAIVHRWTTSMLSDDGETLKNLLSPATEALYCGTASAEVINGARLQDGLVKHISEISGLTCEDSQTWGQDFGGTGWAHWQGTIRNAAAGTEVQGRVTLVLRLEQGIWKVHHVHNSFSTENYDSLGIEHFAFEDLLESAAVLDPQIGRSGSATVMFTDIVGSSSLAEAMGDARWTETVRRHVDDIGALVSGAEGRVIKSPGDGTMSTFMSSGAGMRAAHAIQRQLYSTLAEPRLQVRIGLHTGDVVEAGDDFFGTVVNKAARIAATAQPGEILVSDATRIMVGSTPNFRFADPATVPLKGLEGDHMVYRPEWKT